MSTPDKDLKAISDALRAPFSRDCIKSRVGAGNKRFEYVEGYLVLHRLNDATGNGWDFRVTDIKIQPKTKTTKNGDTIQSELWICFGELTIPGLGTRSGIGVQDVDERSGEDLIKGALTDCIKHCAKHFGVAIDLYGVDREDEAFQAPAAPAAPPATPPKANNAAPATHGLAPNVRINDEQKAQITAKVEAGGGSVNASMFLAWLTKNTANNAVTLDNVLAEDVDELIRKLDDLAAKRKAAS
jgi:hypothetical protein